MQNRKSGAFDLSSFRFCWRRERSTVSKHSYAIAGKSKSEQIIIIIIVVIVVAVTIKTVVFISGIITVEGKVLC